MTNQPTEKHHHYYLGVDLGTSGIRACIVQRQMPENHLSNSSGNLDFPAINNDQRLLTCKILFSSVIEKFNNSNDPEARLRFTQTDFYQQNQNLVFTQNHQQLDSQSPLVWLKALYDLFIKCQQTFDFSKLNGLICDATSSTVMLLDEHFDLATKPLMYNSSLAEVEANTVKQYYEAFNHQQLPSAALGVSSSLAKVLYLNNRQTSHQQSKRFICHQIDWLNLVLSAKPQSNALTIISDENNCLKLGYCPQIQDFPDWVYKILEDKGNNLVLPKVLPAGNVFKPLQNFKEFNFANHCQLFLGTTDSIAGFLATGACENHDIVNSLGSTFAVKQLSARPIFLETYGLYSHKLRDKWLVGGASNSGGKVLLDFYSLKEIIWLEKFCAFLFKHYDESNGSDLPQTEVPKTEEGKRKSALSNLVIELTTLQDFYALSKTGERFPIAERHYAGKLLAQPTSQFDENPFFHLTISEKSNWLNCFLPAGDLFQLSQIIDVKPEQLNTAFAELILHTRFFNSIIHGLVQVEQKAYTLLETFDGQPGNIYTVGGGNQNTYWQLWRAKVFANRLKSSFSEDAAYGVTRLIANHK